MAFAVEDYYDLLRLLSEHPEWRAELRRTVLPDDFESLPDAIRKLTEAQQRTEAALADFAQRTETRFARLEDALARLTEAQQRTEERVGRLEEAMARLTEAQQRTEERVGRLEEAMVALTERTGRLEEAMVALTERTGRLEEAMVALTERTGRLEEAMARLADAQEKTERRLATVETTLARMEPQLAKAVGATLEWRYRDKATGYFATMLRRSRPITIDDLYDLTDGILTEAEQRDLAMVDLVVRGRVRGKGETPEVLLAIEIAATPDDGDVNRAARRASLLRKAGQSAIPVVAGEGLTENARIEAGVRHVAIVHDGSTDLWDEALAAWPPLT